MKIFILSIVKKDSFDQDNFTDISIACKDAHVGGPYYVSSFEELDHVMEQYPNEEYVIFSNFARSSYGLQHEPLPRDTYEYTAIQFQNICMKYAVKAIHLITGAQKFVVQMELVDLLTRNPPEITYKSIIDFPKSNFQAERRAYIVDKIKQLKI